MIQIAICDEDTNFTGELEKLLFHTASINAVKLEIDVFFDGNTLDSCIKQGTRYDLIYLDVNLKGLNGIDLAQHIRKIDTAVLLIYISASEKSLKKLFEVETFRFLSKPLDYHLFTKYFLEACQRISQHNVYYQFHYKKEIHKVPLKEIHYFESHNRIIYIHTDNGSVEQFYGRLQQVEQELSKGYTQFLRIHQSYLVNYEYIYKMNFASVILKNTAGKKFTLRISEDRQKDVRIRLYQMMHRKLV